MAEFELPLIERKAIAENTLEISFGLTDADFSFTAGQYITITLPGSRPHDFSISSSPDNTEKISTAFRISESPFKKTIMQMELGSLVAIRGPQGVFTLRKDCYKPLVFIAGGIGITPFMSMIRSVVAQNLPHQITLLYSNTNEERAAYIEELRQHSNSSPQITLHERYGRIDEDFLQQTLRAEESSLWYLCGPSDMVASMRELLLKRGIKEQDIFFEEFTGY